METEFTSGTLLRSALEPVRFTQAIPGPDDTCFQQEFSAEYAVLIRDVGVSRP